MTGLVDVDRFKICIQDCVLSGFRPLYTKIIFVGCETNMKAIDLIDVFFVKFCVLLLLMCTALDCAALLSQITSKTDSDFLNVCH